MPVSEGLTWGTTSATVNVGETVTVNVTYGMVPTSEGITSELNGLATAVLSGNTVTFTGVSAGTVNVPTGSGVGNTCLTTNPFTLTVASADDQNFLNERGLARVWNNIDTLKQDKLTAGTNITISASNTISASQPTVGNATLTIQKNGTSAGTFTANATSNKTINITVPTTAADVSALPASTKYGASIAVSINTTDYKVTTTLKDQDGNTLGTAQVIDLPLESVVVNGSYDNTNKKIVLTLQNGNTVDIPVGDLVAGLQSEITSTNKLASDLVDDTNQTHKFMTSAEKTKLSGIAAGAEVNVQSDWNQTTTTADDYIKNKPTLATVATSGSYNDLSNKPTIPTVNNATLTIQKNGTNVQTFTANQSTNATANITVPTKTSDLTNDSGFLDSVAWGDVTGKPTFATVATSGSYNDLSNKPTIPAAQVNSDWNATSGKAQILNKPTNVSAFTNDAGYITSYTDTQVKQTSVAPETETTYYPVFSTSPITNTGDVKKSSSLSYAVEDDEGGHADLKLGKTSFQSGSVAGSISLVDTVVGSTYTKITGYRGSNSRLNSTTLQAPNTSGTLTAITAATGSATNPVYADSEGILHATTYSLNATVPSDAVFTDTTYSNATTSAAGLMSAADKTKLNGIASGAEVNVQSDWNVTNTTSDAFIKNKPTIPTVNNGTLTIQKNGTSVATFTANQSGNSTANITVPTIDDVVEIDKTLAAVTDWTNTGIQGTDLETGTYAVQVYTGGSYANTWNERWSGIMSWYSGNTNSSNTEEILLHNAGHADNSQNLFLRTKRDGITVSGTKYLTLQYAFSQANETTTTIKFYFRRII